jgi:hypothetical protein
VAGYTSSTLIQSSNYLGLFLGSGSNYPLGGGYTSASTVGPRFSLVKNRAVDWSSQSTVISGDVLGSLDFAGSDGTTFVVGSRISSTVDGTVATNSIPSRIEFATVPLTGTSVVERMRIDSSGNVGVGASVTAANQSFTVGKPITGGVASYGVASLGQVQTDVTNGMAYYLSFASTITGFTLPVLRHYYSSQGTFSGTVTNQSGFTAESNMISGTANWGFVGSIPFGTNRYNLYMNGTADNFLNGSLGIGTGPGLGTNLAISKALTGAAASFALNINATVASDVTTAGYGASATISTAASAFTVANIYYHPATQGNIGNGSIVTTQSGFLANANMVGATNNYGFYGGLPKPTQGTFTGSTALNVSQSGTTVTVTTTAVHNLVNGQVVTVALTANATALVTGVPCTILTVGTTDYTLIGAASNTVGVSFTATGAGAGTGTVTLNSQGSGKVVASAGTVGVSTTFTYTATSATFAAVTVLTGVITIAANYNIYCVGTADNYFAGAVGIGVTSSGLTDTWLKINKPFTGTNIYGITQFSQVQSDITSFVQGFRNVASQASGTLTTYQHFFCAQATVGGTITAQYGFSADASLVSAVSNIAFHAANTEAIVAGKSSYGFLSAINAATGGGATWGFFGQGTANNYMAGRLWLGSTTPGSIGFANNLDITGATTAYANASGNTIRLGVTASAVVYNTFPSTEAASFTLTALYHYSAGQGTIGSGSSVTNQYGYFSQSVNIGATNNYGFFAGNTSGITSGKTAYGFYSNITTPVGGGTTWGFYGSGNANNFMSGNLWLGSVAPGFVGFANYLDITGAAVAYGNATAVTIRSSVITQANLNYTVAATESATFTLAQVIHYSVSQSTFANSGGVTNQYGFVVNNSLTGATNNYGFFGNIAAGTNRFNLYCAGTAQNYMAGSLGIGNLPSAGQTLFLNQSITGNVNSTAVRQQGTVDLASVTASCYAFDNVAATTATAATLPAYVHYNAQQGTFGAGSTVTTQIGHNASATLIGATNNYGFYAADTAAIAASKTAYGFYSIVNTASGGGTAYGFYAAGTAPNVFNNLGVTTTLGYTTGGGGAVTQLTSRATAVTLNKAAGEITMFTAAGSTAWATFQVNNSLVSATDTVVLSVNGATNSYVMTVSSIAAGAFIILFSSGSGTASDTPKINFTVIKGAIS